MAETSIEWTATPDPRDPTVLLPGFTFNGWWGCTKKDEACEHCLAPDTPVLFADLTWRPIAEVCVGDVLMSFDENPPRPGSPRAMQPALVEKVWANAQPTKRIITEAGDIWASANHRWLSCGAMSPTNRWVETEQLAERRLRYVSPVEKTLAVTDDYRAGYLAGMTRGDGTFRYTPGQRSDKLGFPQAYWRVALADEEPLGRLVAYLANFGIAAESRPFDSGGRENEPRKPMRKVEVRSLAKLETLHTLLSGARTSAEYARGYLAGFFDAEGSHDGNLRMSQKDRSVLERVCEYGRLLGFNFYVENAMAGRNAYQARLSGTIRDRLRFFVVCNPAITRKRNDFWGRELDADPQPVLAVEDGPRMDLIDIQTSTGTFVAGGMATHNCYAETFAHRMDFNLWGKGVARRLQSDKVWNQPAAWSRKAVAAGVRLRVFCGSMKDVFDAEVPAEWRARVFETIKAHPNLNWLLLTKRPENWESMLPWRGLSDAPDNVWLGMTTGSQRRADERLGYMREVPARVKFLSLEPLLTPVNVLPYAGVANWFIWGGESGNPSRPCHEEWLADGVAAGRATGTATFVKQLGTCYYRGGEKVKLANFKGNDTGEWPEALKVREWPDAPADIKAPAKAAS